MEHIDILKEALESATKFEGAAVCRCYFWQRPQETEDDASTKNEKDEDKDYRDTTQGDRNAKYLEKARMYANTPKARLKRQRTELRKDLRQ